MIDSCVYLPLAQAALCVSCDTVYAINGVCPACGSGEFLALARVLNREQEQA